MSTISHRDSHGVPIQGSSTAPMSSNVTGYTHEPSYSHQTSATGVPGTGNEYRGNLPPDPNSNLRGNAQDGSHSAAFGLTPDGHRHTDTTAPTPPGHTSQANLGTNDLSSVSGMDSSSNTTVNTPGDKLHIPPRGTAVRGSSDYAPESISGNVERMPTQRQPGNTDQSNEMVSPVTRDDYNSPNTGYNSTNTGYDSTNAGHNSTNLGHNSTSLGHNSTSLGHNSTNPGYDSTNSSYNPTNTGYDSTNAGHTSTNLGQGSTNPGYDSNNAGYNSTDENNLKKTGTLGKLFKRKPVGGSTQDTTNTGTSSQERKKFF